MGGIATWTRASAIAGGRRRRFQTGDGGGMSEGAQRRWRILGLLTRLPGWVCGPTVLQQSTGSRAWVGVLDAWSVAHGSLGLHLTAGGLTDVLVRQGLHLEFGMRGGMGAVKGWVAAP
jgi:hypothetical protein